MSEKSASFKKGKGNVEHNNREEKIERDNIDNERTKNNIQIGRKIKRYRQRIERDVYISFFNSKRFQNKRHIFYCLTE